jgi:ornithine cyclodeaminase/alanine dehydrogenase-like protein (mu-crystallin family)
MPPTEPLVKILSRADVEALLDLDALVEALADAFVDLSGGRASMPQRVAALSGHGLLGVMPAYLTSADVLETKLVTLFEGNAGTDLPTHQAAIAVFDPERGNMVALMDGTYITATRTAAGAALSVRLLAREDAKVLAICGTGVQGSAHAHAIARVRDFAEVRIAGRDQAKAEAIATEFGATAVATFEEAVRGADVICATTHSPDPVVRREWVAAGAHVTSVGVNPHGRELDEGLVADASVFVESRDAVLAPFPAGANEVAGMSPEQLTEIGEVIAGARPGRQSDDELTVYKSVGIGVMDAAAAALVLRAAAERGRGVEVEL